MTEPALRLRELLARLVSAEIRFVLVGGLAVNAWGHLRGTRDIDIVPDPDPDNLERLAELLVALGGQVEVGGRLLTSESIPTFLRAGDKALVATELGEVDVLQGLPAIPAYPELAAAASTADLEGLTMQVCSLEHLLEMKRATDRALDAADVEALELANQGAGER